LRVLIVAALSDDGLSDGNVLLIEAMEVAADAARRAGHDCVVLDLQADGFCPVMTTIERRAYFGHAPIVDELTDRYAHEVMQAEALVMIYATTLSTMPPLMKGWLDRVLVPGVSFTKEETTGRIRRGLLGVRWIIGVSTYPTTWWETKRTCDGGRRVILRVMRMCAGLRTRTDWVPLYAALRASHGQRERFLRDVERRMSAL
jgi:NAD(P)H dehydrogenase (quinone)